MTNRLGIITTALLIVASALLVWFAPGAYAQPIEGCTWNGAAWIYDDGGLCRGTGEDPTTDSAGHPACAGGRVAALQGARVLCAKGHGHKEHGKEWV